MNRKRVVIGTLVIVLIAGAWLFINRENQTTETTYQFSTVSVGNLEDVISSTGTLSPLTTLEVGTQVSGTIDSVYVDYNDEVQEGQILAVLDTVLLKANVTEAQAALDQAEAAYEEADYNYNLSKKLFDNGLISEADMLPSKVAAKSKAASIESAKAQLERARRNLNYAIIRSPISGTVISKNVESGQTVAASLSTPTLFVVAKDLSHMEIMVDVDESDIGQIKPGQKVRFEVQAYDDVSFEGTVRQVRLQPTTVSNVVTYTAVVEALNKDNLLLPGMTATVDFIVKEKENILLVSNKALKFEPDEKTMQAFFKKHQPDHPPFEPAADRSNRNVTDSETVGSPPVQFAIQTDKGQADSDSFGTVWFLDDGNDLQMAPVKIGMTDGSNTELVASPNITEGSKVIIGTSTGDDAATASTTSRRRMSGFRPPPGF